MNLQRHIKPAFIEAGDLLTNVNNPGRRRRESEFRARLPDGAQNAGVAIMNTFRAAILVSALGLSACTTTGDPYRDSVREQETAGAIVGGIIGGVIGHQFGDGRGQTAMTVLGATAGAMIGGRLARNRAVSEYEQRAAYTAFETTPSGYPVEWRDPATDVYGSYTPRRTYRSPSGEYCREYQQTVVIGGRRESAYGTACREPDGTWRIIN